MPMPIRERLQLSYLELVEQALAEHPEKEVRALLVALIDAYYPGGDAEAHRKSADILAATEQLVAPFHPDTLGYLPEVLLKAMGVELARWLEEGLGRTPTTTDLVKLYAHLPDIGIREAVYQTCRSWHSIETDEGTGAGGGALR